MDLMEMYLQRTSAPAYTFKCFHCLRMNNVVVVERSIFFFRFSKHIMLCYVSKIGVCGFCFVSVLTQSANNQSAMLLHIVFMVVRTSDTHVFAIPPAPHDPPPCAAYAQLARFAARTCGSTRCLHITWWFYRTSPTCIQIYVLVCVHKL